MYLYIILEGCPTVKPRTVLPILIKGGIQMTKVKIEPGICKFSTLVTATASEDEETEVTIKVASGCPSVKKMMEELGNTFLRVCRQKLPRTCRMSCHRRDH